ncbi:hypothetical protein AALP_AA2G020700 [Arabis alpina]|uniref:Mitochondrial transcription termination factor family protein n=1 Tax=Arabis alpina TaxID=50452 RepID=A0A087HES5_ARAAL|nr:hypothetical protein AALP_AA2G020700 [Arabis alpina]
MYSLILHGRRLLELQKCRNFRFSLNPIQNASAFANSFSSVVSSQDDKKGQTFTVSYLVASLGFTTKLAQSISRKVSFQDKGNPDSVLSLLRSHGFTDSQISSVITNYPTLLILDAEKSLGPKLQFLLSRGASSSELTEILSKVPKILGKDTAISVYYDFVKEVIEADKSSEFQKLCHSLPQEGSKQGNKMRNVSVLRELGVPQERLFSLLTDDCTHVCGKERFDESLKKVVDMGFDPTTPKFVKALCVVYQISDKAIEDKVQVYKSVGFAVEDVWEMFKKSPTILIYSEMKIANSMEGYQGLGFSRDEFVMMFKRFPPCIGLSAEAVKKKTELVVKQMNWPLKALVTCPQVFGYSMEKRIVPRCNVIKALLSKGLLGSELPAMSSVFVCTDEVFLNRFVRKHDDKELVDKLMAIFTGKEEKTR